MRGVRQANGSWMDDREVQDEREREGGGWKKEKGERKKGKCRLKRVEERGMGDGRGLG